MRAFTLTVHDFHEEYDDVPATLMPLGEWAARYRAGRIAWRPEYYEGIGIWLRDETAEFIEPCWGNLRHLVRTCETAAERLTAGRLALLRTAILDVGSYLFLVPQGGLVRPVLVLDRPPCGDVFPYHPNPRGETPSAVEALYAWAESQSERVLEPVTAAMDRARGRLLRLPLDTLVADLRTQAAVARQADDLLRI